MFRRFILKSNYHQKSIISNDHSVLSIKNIFRNKCEYEDLHSELFDTARGDDVHVPLANSKYLILLLDPRIINYSENVLANRNQWREVGINRYRVILYEVMPFLKCRKDCSGSDEISRPRTFIGQERTLEYNIN